MDDIEEVYLTPEQIAVRLQVATATVYRWLRSGRLRGARISPKAWRISRGDLESLLRRQNISELLFEEYLTKHRLVDWNREKTFPGSSKHPDYSVIYRARETLFEVKQFVGTSGDNQPSVVACDPYRAIREKIGAARKKFKDLQQYPCCLVLYNDGKPGVFIDSTELGGDIIFAAMLGDIELSVPFDWGGSPANPEEQHGLLRGKRGKMLRQAGGGTVIENTTISAIVVLEHLNVGLRRLLIDRGRWEKSKGRKATSRDFWTMIQQAEGTDHDVALSMLRVVVYENPFARISLSNEIFCGPYDERFEFATVTRLASSRGKKSRS
jgi:excisionase family DNA binding protein